MQPDLLLFIVPWTPGSEGPWLKQVLGRYQSHAYKTEEAAIWDLNWKLGFIPQGNTQNLFAFPLDLGDNSSPTPSKAEERGTGHICDQNPCLREQQ